MKKLFSILAVFILISFPVYAGTSLNAGDVVIISFDTLPFLESSTATNQGGPRINLLGDELEIGDIVRLEVFEDTLELGDAIFTLDFAPEDIGGETDDFGVGIVNGWQDLQGIVRITVLQGTVYLNTVELRVIRDDQVFYKLETLFNVGNTGQAPVADAGDDIRARAGELVYLDGSGSYDSDGNITEYRWYFYEGNGAHDGDFHTLLCRSSSPICHMKPKGWAEQLVTLVVVDDAGLEGSDEMRVINSLIPDPNAFECGDGLVEGIELCDSDTRGCTTQDGYSGQQSCTGQCDGYSACTSSQFCGDSVTNGAEVCDSDVQQCTENGYSGSLVCNSTCDGFNNCVVTERCGDGTINGPEECDDGNTSDGDGCSATCTDEVVSQGTFIIEAENYSTINAPMQVAADGTASGGQYVWTPNGNGNYFNFAPNGWEVTYNVNITVPGTYVLWARVNNPSTADDSFWVQMDSGTNLLWDTLVASGWNWDQVFPRGGADPQVFNLGAGVHTIKFKGREDGAKLDQIILTNDLSYTP